MEVCVFTDEVSPDFEESVRLVKEAGADSVEIRGGLYGKDVTSLTEPDIDRIVALLRQYGLRVASIGSPVGKCSFDNPEDVEKHRLIFGRMIELGRRLDCRLIRCFAFWNPRGRDPLGRARLEEYINPVVDLLQPLVELAEAHGFIYGLEFAPETLAATSSEALMLQHAFRNSPAFQIIWDIAAQRDAGEIPFPNGYEPIKDRIAHVHIKPNSGGSLAVSEKKDIDYAAILNAIHQRGYAGAASIEHWGSSEAMLTGVRQLKTLIDSLH